MDIKLIQNKTLVTKTKPACTQGQSILSHQEVLVQYYLADTIFLPYSLPLLNPALLFLWEFQIFFCCCAGLLSLSRISLMLWLWGLCPPKWSDKQLWPPKKPQLVGARSHSQKLRKHKQTRTFQLPGLSASQICYSLGDSKFPISTRTGSFRFCRQ